MTDERIIELFFARDEMAIKHTADKYENYCFTIANNILSNREDSEECVNDTYLAAWQSIPPERPKQLSAYLGKIARNFALTKHRKERAFKRGGNMNEISLELLELIPDSSDLAEEYDTRRLGLIIDTFLRKIKKDDRQIFVRRYWYGDALSDICRSFGFSETKVKSSLHRTREKLAEELKKEGVAL
ncbi:MAG: sigma-70 family RNA polymerase sigma factor [Clostridia bacterium]|nr:sigma-70 family RNA polymerase sigma factor [Clostridia bacterium]